MKKIYLGFCLFLAFLLALQGSSVLVHADVIIPTPSVDGVDLDALYISGAKKASTAGTVNVFGAGGADNTSPAVYGGDGWNLTLETGGVLAGGAYGVDLGNGSTVTVNGTVSSTADTVAGSPTYNDQYSATGIYTGDSSRITNTGSISATAATDTGSTIYATGVYVEGNGIINNSGNISATSTAVNLTTGDSWAGAYGAYLNSGSFTNSGTVSATATSSTADASAYTGYVYGVYQNYGAFSNLGNISVLAAATSTGDSAYAYSGYYSLHGVYAGQVSSLANSGSISATGSAEATGNVYAYAYNAGAYGVYVGNAGSLYNSGTMQATASAKAASQSDNSQAYVNNTYGAYAGEVASMTNSGTMSAAATATANSQQGNAYGSAYYTYGAYVDTPAQITNSGAITGTAATTATGLTYAYAYTYDTYGLFSDGYPYPLTNSGTISAAAYATANAQGPVYAYTDYTYGIYACEGAYVTNSGTIAAYSSASATSVDSYAYARAYDTYGIYYDYPGSLSNTGIVSAATTASAAGATADPYSEYTYGLYMYYGGQAANSGTIAASTSVAATATSGYAEAEAYDTYGIYADDSAFITNSGTIFAGSSASATGGTDYANAYSEYTYGLYMYYGGQVTNSGTISALSTASAVSAAGSSYSYVYDTYGVYLDDYGALSNSGTISATASSATAITGSGAANAYSTGTYGIYINDMGSVTNSGTISAQSIATANSAAGDAYAFSSRTDGIYMGGSGNIRNSGTISAVSSASATGTNRAEAVSEDISAIYASGVASLENSGLITTGASADATAAAEGGYATADATAAGVYLSQDSPLIVGNSGTISVNARAATSAHYSDAEAVARAVPANAGGTFTNSGTIAATASSTGNTRVDGSDYAHVAYSAGIVASDEIPPSGFAPFNTLSNTGAITAVSTASGNATLPAGATGSAYYYAGAIGVGFGDNSSITNSGTISATASVSGTATVDPEAAGRAVYGAPEDSPMAVGVYQGNDSTLANSGTIVAAASVNGTPTPYDSVAVWMGDNAVIENSGTIMSGTGIAVGDNATITNSGTIIGTNVLSSGPGADLNGDGIPDMPTAIDLNEGENTVKLMTGSNIVGAIDGLSSPATNHLILDSTGNDSINADQLRGFTTIQKTGTGTWTIAREQLGTGLAITGSIAVDQGTLAFGGNAATDTYTQAAGARTGFALTPTTAGRITAASANLNNGGWAAMMAPGYYAPYTDYGTVFTSGAPFTDATGFDMANVNSPALYLIPTMTHPTANTYNLSMVRDFTTTAQTENQHAVASAFNTAYDWDGMDPNSRNVLNRLAVSSEPIPYDRLAGFIHSAAFPTTFGIINQYLGTLNGRMGGFITGGPENMADAAFMGPLLAQSTDPAVSDASRTLLSSTKYAPDKAQWGFWAKGYGNWGKRDGSDIDEKYKYNTGGIAIGLDKKVNPALLVGASFGYAHTKLDMDDVDEDSKIDSYQASIYGVFSCKPWYLDGILSYGYNKYDTSRTFFMPGGLGFGTDANYHGQSFTGYLEAGYRAKVNGFDLIPMASLQYSKIWMESFDESGAGILSLYVDSENADSFLGTLGIRIRKELVSEEGTFIPEFRARWVHEFSNSDYKVNAGFGGSPGIFTVRTDRPDRDSALLGLGVNAVLKNNTSFFANFDANFGNEQQNYLGSVGFRYRW